MMAQIQHKQQELAELAEKINDFLPSVDLTVLDLKNPTQDVVSKVYQAFLEELGVNLPNLFQIQSNQMTAIEHVDMYSATIPLLNFYHCLNYFFSELKVDDFVLSDLTNPTSKKTVCYFKHFLQFISYADYIIAEYGDELERISQIRSRRQELNSKLELVKNELNKNISERVTRQEDMKKLANQIEISRGEMQEAMRTSQQLAKAQEERKKLIEQASEKETEAVRLIKNLEDEIRDLKSKLVTSPGKLKENLELFIKKRDEKVKTLKELKMQIEEKKIMKDSLLKKQEEQKGRLEMINKFMVMKNRIKDMSREYEAVAAKRDKIVEKHKLSAMQIEEFQLIQKKLEDNLLNLKTMKEKRNLEGKDAIKKTENDLNLVRSSMKEQKAYQHHLQMQINELLEEIDKKKQEFEDYRVECFKLSEKYSTIVNELVESMKNRMMNTVF